jgi:hypothetical protein
LQTTKASSKLGPLAALWKMKISYHIQAKKIVLDAHPQQTSSTNRTEEKENNPTYNTKQNKTIHKRRKPTSTSMPNWESV